MMRCLFILGILVLAFSCDQKSQNQIALASLWPEAPSIEGKETYLKSPMFTPGNRVYAVGHQDGSFPELGWHIPGEMGGIWDHPIKLMDGFDIVLQTRQGDSLRLDQAHRFVNYPFFSKFEYDWPSSELKINRWQFVPDDTEGLLVQLEIENQGPSKKLFLHFTGHSDLRPTWLGERTQMIDGPDVANWNESKEAWSVTDSINSWHVVYGSNLPYVTYNDTPKNDYKGNGRSNEINYQINIPSGNTSTVNFVIAGSYTSETEAWETYNTIHHKYEQLFQEKKERYQKLATTTKLRIPDPALEKTFEWLKYNSDWLVRTVPEIGTGIGAGIPDYPWWFGVDSEYALQGYMMFGQRETVYQTIALLDSVSEAVNGNGRILHEMSTNGSVFNHGNINETPQFASLIWKIYQWNGDRSFLERYFPTIEKGLSWLLAEKDANGNGFPDGFGMMEIHGLDSEMIDVAAYTQKAFADASQMAAVLNKMDLSKKYNSYAQELKEKINTEFWSETFGSYADFIGNDTQALHLIADAIIRADTLNKPWAVEELEQTKEQVLTRPSQKDRPFVLHHNWVVNTPMEVGLASNDKALKGLTTAERFVNPYGVFVTGIDRDASAGNDQSSFKGPKVFSYTGAVMTLPTGVLAIAENNYGRPDHALNYLQRMTRTFSYAFPGSMYEVSPDYGMMTQAWNAFSYAIPIVEQFFGIRPMAAEKHVRVQPQMPTAWDNASLEHVPIGDNSISMEYGYVDRAYHITLEQTKPDWTLEVILDGVDATDVTLYQGEAEIIQDNNQTLIRGKGKVLEIHYHYE